MTANCPTDPKGIYSEVIGLFLYNVTVVLFVITNYFLIEYLYSCKAGDKEEQDLSCI